MASNTKTKVPLNINWDVSRKIWHIMVLSYYIERGEKTIVPSCQLHIDKEDIKKHNHKIHRDWLDRPNIKFPDGNNFKNGNIKYPDLNFKNICPICINKETNIEEFKTLLIVQKLENL